MSFPLDQMRGLNRPLVRVVVAATQGSVPREVGASMLVSEHEVWGTIGGGALEYEAIARARDVLASKVDRLDRLPLGPGLGQCCGGAVTLLTELWDPARLLDLPSVVARPLPGNSADLPLTVKRLLSKARSRGERPKPGIVDGWMIEPVDTPDREIWIWGAGHVGRAVVKVLAELPSLKLRWVDTDRTRFPTNIPDGVDVLIAENPADLVTLSGEKSEHYVLTFSHALDLEICHRLLGRPFQFLGLIGSDTKRARFRKRLASLGHSQPQIDRMVCPIGDPALGKHPQAIALGIAVALLSSKAEGASTMEHRA